ncbi:hypothetical protein KXW25_007403 [Aspergillus fumigatus]|nr:hypothetical protein KXX42_001194 [Aspergillus fumigatus]KAH2917037.1 hypothetical protein KXW25_007403 [Aspergillus fumigatus]
MHTPRWTLFRNMQHTFPQSRPPLAMRQSYVQGSIPPTTWPDFSNTESDKVWNYRYNVQDPPRIAAGLGVTHTFDLQAIFGLNYGSSVSSSMRDINAPIIPVVMHYYISFIRTLNPNLLKADSAPFWKPWGDGERLKVQTNATAMETVSAVQWDRCSLWKRLAPVLEV